MAANVTFVYLGPPEQRAVVKVSPMATLRGALADASAKWRPALDAATATASHNRKPVDLDVAFRLLNLPSGARLDVARGGGGGGGAGGEAGTPKAPPVGVSPAAAAAAGAPQSAAPAPAAAAAAASPSAPAAAAPAAPAAAPPPPAEPAAVDPELAALGIPVPIAVFSQAAVEAAAAAAAAAAAQTSAAGAGATTDPPDDFYEFTADDYAAAAAAAQRRAAAESVLMTRTAREAAVRARVAALPPVPVRLHFPDKTIVQASLPAASELRAVAALARALVAPGPTADGLYLYTAPPKVVLKVEEGGAGAGAPPTLYSAGLVPAAHVHVGSSAPPPAGASWLRPEVAARTSDVVPETTVGRSGGGAGGDDEAGGAGQRADPQARERALAEARRRAASLAAGGSSGVQDGDGGAKKLPKWLKR